MLPWSQIILYSYSYTQLQRKSKPQGWPNKTIRKLPEGQSKQSRNWNEILGSIGIWRQMFSRCLPFSGNVEKSVQVDRNVHRHLQVGTVILTIIIISSSSSQYVCNFTRKTAVLRFWASFGGSRQRTMFILGSLESALSTSYQC